jgi:hypothetical protein
MNPWAQRLRERIEHGDLVPTDAQRKALEASRERQHVSLPPLMPRADLWPRQGPLPWPHGVPEEAPHVELPTMPAPRRAVVTTTHQTPKAQRAPSVAPSPEPDPTLDWS